MNLDIDQVPNPGGAAVNTPAIVTQLNTDTGPSPGPAAFGFNISGMTQGFSDTAQVMSGIAGNERAKADHLWAMEEGIQAEKDWSEKLTNQLATGQPYNPHQFDAEFQADMHKRADTAPSEFAKTAFQKNSAEMGLGFFKQNLGAMAQVNQDTRRARLKVTFDSIKNNPNMNFQQKMEAASHIGSTAEGNVMGASGMASQAQVEIVGQGIQNVAQSKGPGVAASVLRSGFGGAAIPPVQREISATDFDNAEKTRIAGWQATAQKEVDQLAEQVKNGKFVDPATRQRAAQNLATAKAATPFPSEPLPLLDVIQQVEGQATEQESKVSGRDAMSQVAIMEGLKSNEIQRLIYQRFIGSSPKDRAQMMQDFEAHYGKWSEDANSQNHPYLVAAKQANNEIDQLTIPGTDKYDPVTAALRMPNVQASLASANDAMNKAMSLPNGPDKTTALVAAKTQHEIAIQTSFAAQKIQGIPPGQERLLSKDQATSAVQKINQLHGAEAVQAIHSFREMYGDHADRAFEDIAVLPPRDQRLGIDAQYIGAMGADDPRALALANGMNRPPQDADAKAQNIQKTWSGEGPEKFTKALQTNDTWNQFARTLAQTSPEDMLLHQGMIVRQADYLLGTGQAKDEAEAVSKAVSNSVGAVNLFSGGLRIPTYDLQGRTRTQSDAVQIGSTLDLMRTGIINSGNFIPQEIPAQKLGVIQDVATRWHLIKAAQQTGWQTTHDGQGAQLMSGTPLNGEFSAQRPMLQKNGKPIIVDYDKAAAFAQTLQDTNEDPRNFDPSKLGGSESSRVGVLKDADYSKFLREIPDAPSPRAIPNDPAPAPVAGQTKLQAALPEPMRGLAPVFEEMGAKYGVDPKVLAAISMHETGGGTSRAFREHNNAMGVSNQHGPISFDDPAKSIGQMARMLGQSSLYSKYRQTGDLADLAAIYAPVGAGNDPKHQNGDWPSGVSKFLKQLKGQS